MRPEGLQLRGRLEVLVFIRVTDGGNACDLGAGFGFLNMTANGWKGRLVADQEPTPNIVRGDDLGSLWTANLKLVTRAGIQRPTSRRACVMNGEIDHEGSRLGIVLSRRIVATLDCPRQRRHKNLHVIVERQTRKVAEIFA